MDPRFEESRPIMPRSLSVITAAVLIATAAFMAVYGAVVDTDMPSWAVPAISVAFAVVIVLCLVLRMELAVTDDGVAIVYAFKRTEIGADEIIDMRFGDLGDIRNYANWNLKGVKHSSFSCIGDEGGIALKLLGKRVVVVSTEDPEAVSKLIPMADKEAE